MHGSSKIKCPIHSSGRKWVARKLSLDPTKKLQWFAVTKIPLSPSFYVKHPNVIYSKKVGWDFFPNGESTWCKSAIVSIWVTLQSFLQSVLHSTVHFSLCIKVYIMFSNKTKPIYWFCIAVCKFMTGIGIVPLLTLLNTKHTFSKMWEQRRRRTKKGTLIGLWQFFFLECQSQGDCI